MPHPREQADSTGMYPLLALATNLGFELGGRWQKQALSPSLELSHWAKLEMLYLSKENLENKSVSQLLPCWHIYEMKTCHRQRAEFWHLCADSSRVPFSVRSMYCARGMHRRSEYTDLSLNLTPLLIGCVALGKNPICSPELISSILKVFQVALRIRGHGHLAYVLVCKSAHKMVIVVLCFGLVWFFWC